MNDAHLLPWRRACGAGASKLWVGRDTAFDLRQIALTEPAALGQDFLSDPVQFPDPPYHASQPQAPFGDLCPARGA